MIFINTTLNIDKSLKNEYYLKTYELYLDCFFGNYNNRKLAHILQNKGPLIYNFLTFSKQAFLQSIKILLAYGMLYCRDLIVIL